MPYTRTFSHRRPQRSGPTRRNYSNKRRNNSKENIHPSRFIKAARPVEAVEYQAKHAFKDFEMHQLLRANIDRQGYTQPSAIQDQAITPGMIGLDVVGVANTGTGKTVAFAVPILHRLLTDPQAKALIMAPTRELASQIEDACRTIGRGAGFYGALLIGGTPMGPQLRDLRTNPRIVIGTPGRIKDHMERGSLNLADFNLIALDEVDRMLDMGFINDVREILRATHADRQSFFFSATLDGRVRSLVESFARDPVIITVTTGKTSDNVEQNIVAYTSKEDKIAKLHHLLNGGEVSKVVIFDETQRSVERLHQVLQARGFQADAIHGGKSQAQRQRALNRFKASEVTVLVATDVAARGIDVADITHVINYATPQTYEDYVHRIGRAGRAGRIGYALTFIEQ